MTTVTNLYFLISLCLFVKFELAPMGYLYSGGIFIFDLCYLVVTIYVVCLGLYWIFIPGMKKLCIV
jgi:hypothetical protein